MFTNIDKMQSIKAMFSIFQNTMEKANHIKLKVKAVMSKNIHKILARSHVSVAYRNKNIIFIFFLKKGTYSPLWIFGLP